MSDVSNGTEFAAQENPFRGGPRVLRRLWSWIGVRSDKPPIGFLLAVIFPLLLLGTIAGLEEAFSIGSVREDVTVNDVPHAIVGMSFLGDAMVWPYCFLVPAGLLLLAQAYATSRELLEAARRNASDGWCRDESPLRLAAAVARTRELWRMRVGGFGKVLRYGPWLVALFLFAYNFDTCSFQWVFGYPYSGDEVRLVRLATDPSVAEAGFTRGCYSAPVEIGGLLGQKDEPVMQSLATPIPLPKWDTCPTKRRASWLAARVWSLIYYGLPPFYFAQFVALIWGVLSFLATARAWERQGEGEGRHAFRINTFATDEFGGLAFLSDAVITYLYVASFFAILIGMSLLRESIEPSWHNYALLILVLPVAGIAVALPSLAVRRTIHNAKRAKLKRVTERLQDLAEELVKDDDANAERTKARRERMGDLRGIQEQVRSMPEWPFDALTLARMALPLTASLLPPALQVFASRLFE